ncbi:MAG: sortase, partial [Anaerolineae bacterium]
STSTGNNTTTGTSVTAYAGETATLGAESLTTGSASNYTATLTCTGVADTNLADGLTINGADTNIVCTYTNTLKNADLELTKTLDTAGPFVPGQSVQFTITVTNNGPDTATGLNVADTDTNLTVSSATSGTFTCAGNAFPCTLASLTSGSSATITVSGTIDTAGSFNNQATVTSTSHDPDTSDNTDNDGGTATAADLRLTKTVDNATPNIGSNVIFTVTVFNDGPSNATGVAVGDLLPAGYAFVSSTTSQGTYVNGTGVWTVGAINNGSSANIQITATVGATGPYANTAQVTASNQSDPDSTPNNSNAAEDDQATVTPVPVAVSAPSISKSFSPNPINVNGVSTLTFTITNPNTGTSLTGVAFTDTFPAGMQVAGTPNASTNNCGAPTFAPAAGNTSLSFSGGTIAASGTCTVTVDVTATTGGSKVNTTGNVTSTNGGTGNTGTDTLNVNVPVDLQATKDDGVTSFIAGGTLTYTIKVWNTGPNAATGATLTDPRPAEFSSWSWTCTATGVGSACGTPSNAASGTADISVTGINLPADPTGINNFLTYTVTAIVDSATTANNITNTVTVTEPAGTLDTDKTNNSASDTDGQIFDPPSAFKTFTAIGGIPVLEFRMVWVNNGNAAAINVQVTDTIPAGTTYVPLSVTCTATNTAPVPPVPPSSTAAAASAPLNTAGVLPVSSCGYDPATNSIQWQGTIAPDPGVLNDANAEANANNEIVITFQVTVNGGINSVSNVGTSRTDADNNGDFVSQADVLGTTIANSNLVSWSRDGNGGGGPGVRVATVSDPVVLPTLLPATGFAPNRVTILPEQPEELAYRATSVWLEVPRLGLKMPIVGVPLYEKDWDISWLWKEAGWLEGTAFPTWQGNSVLTSHVTLPNGEAGPFASLGKLQWGDRVLVHAYGTVYIYEVRANQVISPNDTSILKHEDDAWLTLLTCKTYIESTNTYSNRIAVRAVLIGTQVDKTPSGKNVR